MYKQMSDTELSPWWRRTLFIVMAIGFALLIVITWLAYDQAPPIPSKVIDEGGVTVATREDIEQGQTIFLRYGLMDNGSVWGHGGYLGPDYAATALHLTGEATAEYVAKRDYGLTLKQLNGEQLAAVDGQVIHILKLNRYNVASDILVLGPSQAQVWKSLPKYWANYFIIPANNGGLRPNLITDQVELRQLSAFFSWAAWASVTNRPDKNYSFTNNFPYDPSVGNVPVSGALLWSALSLIVLMGGISAVLFAFGRFENMGWVSHPNHHVASRLPLGPTTLSQQALVKFFVVVALLFLVQTLVGGALAHYRAEPGDFYGLQLERLFPSNLLRSWHLQAAIFWIATAFVAAALFLAISLRTRIPHRLVLWINLLFVAFVIVIVGSMLGIWAGLWQWLGGYWYLLGDQGWEYLELGRLWQILLIVGLFIWFALLFWLVRPSLLEKKPVAPIVKMFLFAALAIPVFYIPALFIGEKMNYTVVDTWRFWIIHLWVEGYFEFFATTIVALTFYQLGITQRNVALKVIYFDAILYFFGGVVGTGHHWYFNGQSQFNMAASALASALEVVPLTLLTLDAWDFVRTTRSKNDSNHSALRHKWVFYFLIAVGFWNFIGAGVFGFLINLPIVSYYEVGTILTANHAHAAMMGVFGMLALAMMVLVVQQSVDDRVWPKLERYVKIAFFGTNIGLTLMVVLSLFPGGILQVWDVLENGYWHARGRQYTSGQTAILFEWLRMLGDSIFILFGSLPITIFAIKGWLQVRNNYNKT
ncbi:nitric-oxide reductase large subunit [Rahnella sp. NRRL B-41462]|uniref:nitric-oxide reductase large subunit n=1 Tax=Rahnella sp. NRRL B-41462 TaxID=1610579 RepID=UPI0018E4E8B2|nr:cbb3-type cytochrome c oxidase subunit I [Rahnella sp. NRRL B-41462]